MKPSLALLLAAAALLPACGSDADAGELTGEVNVDGSSTVFPITEAVAEEFRTEAPRVRVTVGVSGTGGGFKRFVRRETDINDASRPIKASEIELARQNGIEFIEIPIAYDGIAVVVNPENDFADALTMEQLHRVWRPGSSVRRWSDIDPSWPDEEISLYGPGTDSGTFQYFTEVVNGEDGASRPDFTASEDDNILVTGVSGDPHALGYFGFAYATANPDRLKLLAIDGGDGPVRPTPDSIRTARYPLSRPVFVYVREEALERPAVAEFLRFYLENVSELAPDVGAVPLSPELVRRAGDRLQARRTGTMFTEAEPGTPLEEVFRGAERAK